MSDYDQSQQTIGILRGLFLVHPGPEETEAVPDATFDNPLIYHPPEDTTDGREDTRNAEDCH